MNCSRKKKKIVCRSRYAIYEMDSQPSAPGPFWAISHRFSIASCPSIQLQKSVRRSVPQQREVQAKKTFRLLRCFAQSRVVGVTKPKTRPLVTGMALYDDDTDMDKGSAEHPDSRSFSTCAAGNK